jgi:hypothetical protein
VVKYNKLNTMLPKNLKYGTKIESAVARSSRVNIQPQNGTSTYGPNDTIIFNLPTRNNLVMVPTESYLKFNVVFTSGAADNAFRWDSCGAHGIIQRIRVFHGSNLLQDIDNYGLLAKMLFDLQQSTDGVYGKQNILSGTRSDLSITTLAVAAVGAGVAVPAIPVGRLPAIHSNSGERLLSSAGGNALIANAGTTASFTYCLNLVSLVGSLCSSSYIPLFAMTSAPLRVEIQLVPNAVNACACLTGTTNNTFALTNCEYVANMIELGDSAMQTIYSSLGGEPLQFVVPDFRNYQFNGTIPTGNLQTQIVFPIPAKFTSLKALFITVRDKGIGAQTFFPYSSVACGIQEYYFRLGATTMPSKNPSTLPEMFSEVVKAIGSIGDINYQPSIDKASYSLPVSVANNDVATEGTTSSVSSGSFYIGLDLENYASADKSSIFSGYNSNNDDCFVFLTFSQNTGAINARFDSFANFDTVVVCENGTSYVKF